MFDPVADIEEFHKRFGLEYTGKPRCLPVELLLFRQGFMREELDEYDACTGMALAILKGDVPPNHDLRHELADALDSLVDLVYVALGTAYLHGYDFREAWRRVHEANMKKVRVERIEDSKRGSTFDVVKPPGWQPPSHYDLVQDHAHK